MYCSSEAITLAEPEFLGGRRVAKVALAIALAILYKSFLFLPRLALAFAEL
jgi:hypothetical protein